MRLAAGLATRVALRAAARARMRATLGLVLAVTLAMVLLVMLGRLAVRLGMRTALGRLATASAMRLALRVRLATRLGAAARTRVRVMLLVAPRRPGMRPARARLGARVALLLVVTLLLLVDIHNNIDYWVSSKMRILLKLALVGSTTVALCLTGASRIGGAITAIVVSILALPILSVVGRRLVSTLVRRVGTRVAAVVRLAARLAMRLAARLATRMRLGTALRRVAVMFLVMSLWSAATIALSAALGTSLWSSRGHGSLGRELATTNRDVGGSLARNIHTRRNSSRQLLALLRWLASSVGTDLGSNILSSLGALCLHIDSVIITARAAMTMLSTMLARLGANASTIVEMLAIAHSLAVRSRLSTALALAIAHLALLVACRTSLVVSVLLLVLAAPISGNLAIRARGIGLVVGIATIALAVVLMRTFTLARAILGSMTSAHSLAILH